MNSFCFCFVFVLLVLSKCLFSFDFESSESFFFFFQQSSLVEFSFSWFWLTLFNFLLISIESTVNLSFQQNTRVEFSFSCLCSLNFGCRLSFDFSFISWEASCLFKMLIGYSRSEWRNLSVGYFSCFNSPVPNSYREPKRSSRQIEGGSFLVPYYLELLLLFPLWPNQLSLVVGLIFFLEINFYSCATSFFVVALFAGLRIYCFFCRGIIPPPLKNGCPRYNTKLHLVVKLQFRRSG